MGMYSALLLTTCARSSGRFYYGDTISEPFAGRRVAGERAEWRRHLCGDRRFGPLLHDRRRGDVGDDDRAARRPGRHGGQAFGELSAKDRDQIGGIFAGTVAFANCARRVKPRSTPDVVPKHRNAFSTVTRTFVLRNRANHGSVSSVSTRHISTSQFEEAAIVSRLSLNGCIRGMGQSRRQPTRTAAGDFSVAQGRECRPQMGGGRSFEPRWRRAGPNVQRAVLRRCHIKRTGGRRTQFAQCPDAQPGRRARLDGAAQRQLFGVHPESSIEQPCPAQIRTVQRYDECENHSCPG